MMMENDELQNKLKENYAMTNTTLIPLFRYPLVYMLIAS